MNKLPTLAPQTMGEAIEFSKMVAGSGMVPNNYKNKPQDVLVAVQWGYEMGLQPLQALQNIAVINGKPSVYGDAALALVKNHPHCRGVSETVQGQGDQRQAVCTIKRAYGDETEETTRTFSVADAKRAKLWGRQGPWSQYPDRMLAMRARGFATRDAFPDALKGLITAEEAQDYPEDATKPRNVTPPPNPLDAIEGPSEPPAETVDQDTGEVIEAAPEPAQSEPEPVEAVVMLDMKTHKGTVMESFPGHDEFTNAFMNLIKRYAKADKDKNGREVSPREKMTMLRELREANQATLDSLSEEYQGYITELYKKSLSRLGAETNNGS